MDNLSADDSDKEQFFDEAEAKPNPGEATFDHTGFGAGGKPRMGSVNINPQARQPQRNRLRRLTKIFLSSGGQIAYCRPGPRPNFRFGEFKARTIERSPRASSLTHAPPRGENLSEGDERDLIRAVRATGDEQAKRKLFDAFHRWILTIAAQYSGPPTDDLASAAFRGFWEAVSKFNLRSNIGRLSTYAEICIRKRLSETVYDWRS
jgi:DNA-directed RNA polymerase sigma subunit (sigma70/sigma32)